MATAADNEACISSDELDRPLLCKPCGKEGNSSPAVGFCVNCCEHLCQRCYDGHLIPSVTRKHVLELLDTGHSTETGHKSKFSCKQHEDKNIEYHCPTHSFLGCHVCFFQHQNSCRDVVHIPKVSMTTDSSEECSNFNKKLTHITTLCTEFLAEIKSNKQTLNSDHEEAVAAMRDFKREILDMIDKLEKELVEKADKVQQEETTRMDELSMQCETILKDTKKMSATVETLQNKDQTCDLYIEMVQSKDKALDLEDQVQAVKLEKQIKRNRLKANKDLAEVLKNRSRGLGSLGFKKTTEKVEHVRDLNCKSVNDAHDCCIMGLVMLPGQKLIVTDWNTGNTVKLVDIQQNKILSHLKLSSSIYGLCKISDTLVAVTLPNDKKIAILRLGQNINVEKEIKVNGDPLGIAHLDGNLVVSYIYPDKVEIMEMQDTVINTFDKDNNGQALFNRPFHVAIHPDNKQIYVSNYHDNNVVCMTFDGTDVTTYKDKELANPRQVTFDSSGRLYVCGEGSHNVHQITEDCQKVKVILTQKDGLDIPCSMWLDENDVMLYIGQWGCDSVKVYKAEYSYYPTLLNPT